MLSRKQTLQVWNIAGAQLIYRTYDGLLVRFAEDSVTLMVHRDP